MIPPRKIINVIDEKHMFQLGSHDTMTYSSVRKWWMKLIKFTGKCQEVSIKDQYEKYGIRMFDLRITFDGGQPVFAHGIFQFKPDVFETLKWIESHPGLYVRIILEENNEVKGIADEEKFINFCKVIEDAFPNTIFFGGQRKYDWNVIYNFKNQYPSIDDKYSSTTGTKMDDLYPKYYAKNNNAKNIANGTDKDWMLIDFVNIQ